MRDRLSDLVVLLGIVCLVAGAVQINVALAWAVAGLSIIGYGLLLGLTTSKRKG